MENYFVSNYSFHKTVYFFLRINYLILLIYTIQIQNIIGQMTNY